MCLNWFVYDVLVVIVLWYKHQNVGKINEIFMSHY